MLNENFLSKISEEFDVKEIKPIKEGFSCYEVESKKSSLLEKLRVFRKLRISVLLSEDYAKTYEDEEILNCLPYDKKVFKEYVCFFATKVPQKENCLNFNGKDFAHFVFVDKENNSLVYEKGFYYSGSKNTKRLMDLFKQCFDEQV